MKMTKKLGSVLLAVLLLLSLSVTAFASETPTSKVTVADELSRHTFTAYQIFTGTQNAESGNALASVKWGSDIDARKFVTALQAIDPVKFADCKADDAQSVVKALSGADKELAEKIAEAAYDSLSGAGTAFSDSTELPNGYYLIKDTTDNLNGNEAYNDVVLQVTTDVTVTYKTDVPEAQKKVQDNDNTNWQDSADWDIGDDVPFQITGTLPSNYGDYETYAITFHDEESKGLTFKSDSVKVMVGDTDITSSVTINPAPSDGCTFEIVIANLKDVAPDAKAGDQVVVTYNSKLNDSATVGPDGNPNTMTMEFSNNAHGKGTGKTPEDKVVVFTYQFDANKVDEKTESLEGAGFTLLKKVAGAGNVVFGEGTDDEKTYEDYVEVKKYTVEDGKATFEFKGLDDGDYILVESTVPAGYNKAADIEFTITASHEDGFADPKLLTFTAKGAEGSDINVDQKDTEVTGQFSVNVVNQSGLELPETGGMGTTIFYVVGGVLVAVALILLVTKRRVKAEQ